MAKIHSGFTKTYPRNTTTKGLLYTFSLCENIKKDDERASVYILALRKYNNDNDLVKQSS